MAQLSLASIHSIHGCIQCPCISHFILIPFPATSNNEVSPGAAQTLFGREGAIDLGLSQEPCGRPSVCWTCSCSHPGPCTGLGDIIVPKHSPYCLIFQCLLQFLVTNLHICWGNVGCWLCSSEDQLGASHILFLKKITFLYSL